MTTLIQSNNGSTGSNSSVIIPLPSSTTPGNFLVAPICLPTDVIVQSITDSTNNRWIQNSNAFSDGGNSEIWSARGIQGGVASVTVTVTASSQLSNEYDATDVYDSFGTYDGAASIGPPAVIATVGVGGLPQSAVVLPDGSAIYVTNNNDGTVSVINTTTNTVTHTLATGGNPGGICSSPNGASVYVVDGANNLVDIILTSTNVVSGTTIGVGSSPFAAVSTPNGASVYVANAGDGTVSVINTTTNTTGSPIHIPGSLPLPESLAITPSGASVFVANSGGNNVSVINTITNTIPGSPISVGTSPSSIAITPNGLFAYVTNVNDGTVSVINTTTQVVTDSIFIGLGVTGISLSPDGLLAYVANENSDSVVIIDTTSNMVAGSGISVGNLPISTAITPSGQTLYVVNNQDNTVSVIQTNEPGVVGSVSVNVSEWSGVYVRDPVDTWSQNYGTSASPTINTLQPRTNGDLVITAVSSSASVGAVPSGYTVLTESGSSGYGAAYQVLSGSVATSGHWTASDGTWAVAACAFVPAPIGTPVQVNPLLQFPEVLVEMSTQGDFMAPMRGTGVWTNFSQYVKQFDVQGIGRSHLLDRVNSTQTTIMVDNRSGNFQGWNSNSFLWNSGLGMKPMNPVRIVAAWSGQTFDIAYGYLQEIVPVINDVLNIDATIALFDILALLNLGYLSSDVYAQLILSGN